MVKNLPAVQETRIGSLGWEDPLEKGMTTHSSILAWRILWMEEPGGLQSIGSQRLRRYWATNTSKYNGSCGLMIRRTVSREKKLTNQSNRNHKKYWCWRNHSSLKLKWRNLREDTAHKYFLKIFEDLNIKEGLGFFIVSE